LVYFGGRWNGILWQFVTFYDYLVYFMSVLHIL
jgi:hypothetical protein